MLPGFSVVPVFMVPSWQAIFVGIGVLRAVIDRRLSLDGKRKWRGFISNLQLTMV